MTPDQDNLLDDQILDPVGYDFGLTRRTFVQVLGAGLLIAASGPTLAFAQDRPRRSGGFRRDNTPLNLNARLHLGKDGSITLFSGKVEGGQGARTELTQAAAEELGVAPDRIQLILADTSLVPDDGMTVGSRTTPSTVPPVRQACAAARQLLERYAVNHKGATYADLASSEDAIQSLSEKVPQDVQLTLVKEWKVMGVPAARPNRRDIVTGSHQYPSDILRPEMFYGKVLRPPSYGAKLKSIDLAAAKAMNDVTVVRDNDFIAVAAPTTHQARQAIAAIEPTGQWETTPQVSSKDLFDYLRKNADVPENPFKDSLSFAAKTLQATYHVPYVQHAPLEPRAAVAEWSDDGHLTVWTGTQNPFGVRRELAGAFHIDESKVRVIVPDFGAAFGGKHTGEMAVEAARIAQGAKRPVSLRWTRVEEFTWAYFRPAAVIETQATLNAAGNITSWHFININSGPSAVETPYRIENSHCKFVQSAPPLRHGSYRALAATANNFAREGFMDELARAAGKDPLEFRLAHLENPRLRAVLEKAAKEFDWSNRRHNSQPSLGVGLACGTEKGSCVATCVQLFIDRTNKNAIRVQHVTQAFECGAIVNPDNLRNQIAGAIVMGLGPALREAMEFENGQIQNASFWKYRPPRFSDLPDDALDIHLLNRPDLPSAGAGETPLICIAPAIANAIAYATHQPQRRLPLRVA